MKFDVWAGAGILMLTLAAGGAQHPEAEQGRDVVERVVDGDTVILRGLGRSRLIGVDSPEIGGPASPMESFGLEAARFAEKELGGRGVRVERDVESRDRHGRALVYLYLEDGGFFNLRLVRQGFAYAYTIFPTRFQFELLKAEDEAREDGVGLWRGLSAGECSRPLHGNSRSHVYHSGRCEYYSCLNCTVEFRGRLEAEQSGFRPHWDCIGNR